jgi:hypothetical protein
MHSLLDIPQELINVRVWIMQLRIVNDDLVKVEPGSAKKRIYLREDAIKVGTTEEACKIYPTSRNNRLPLQVFIVIYRSGTSILQL